MILNLRARAARVAERITLRQIHSSNTLSIQANAGTGEDLVIVFGSLQGNLAARTEMVGTASAKTRAAIFVRDLTSGWYQSAADAEVIRRQVGVEVARRRPARVLCVGDSMGAYAALAFAADLGATAALAFGPQWSPDPQDVPEETRWTPERRAIPSFDLGSLDRYLGDGPQYFALHGREGADIVHWSRFPVRAGLHHYLLTDRWHDIAQWLKDNGALSRCFELALTEDTVAFDAFMAEIGGARRRVDETLETTPNDWFENEYPIRAAARRDEKKETSHDGL